MFLLITPLLILLCAVLQLDSFIDRSSLVVFAVTCNSSCDPVKGGE